MRNYFSFDLKGSKIFVPILTGILIMCGIAIALFFIAPGAAKMFADLRTSMNPIGEESVQMALKGMSVTTNPFLSALLILVLYCVELLIIYGITFFIVRNSIVALSYKEERFVAEYDFRRYLFVILKGILLTFITVGIYYPWFLRDIIRYFASGTYYRNEQFSFRGKGITLFSVIVLLVVLPQLLFILCQSLIVFKMGLNGSSSWLSFIMFVAGVVFLLSVCAAEALIYRWKMNFEYGQGKRILMGIKAIDAAFFLLGQFLLMVITFGLYIPMFILRYHRYFISRVYIGTDNMAEYKLGFTLNAWNDYLFVFGQILLTIITIGIYFPWALARIYGRLITHTYVEEIDDKLQIAMPKELE